MIEISGFEMSQIKKDSDITGMLEDVISLKYLNLKNVHAETSLFKDLSDVDLTICQDESFVIGTSITSDGCQF